MAEKKHDPYLIFKEDANVTVILEEGSLPCQATIPGLNASLPALKTHYTEFKALVSKASGVATGLG